MEAIAWIGPFVVGVVVSREAASVRINIVVRLRDQQHAHTMPRLH